MKTLTINFGWKPLPPEVEDRLQAELDSWLGTPYALGRDLKGIGVDCVNFVCSVLIRMDGQERLPIAIRELRGDACLHRPDLSAKAMQTILRLFSPHRELEAGEAVEPGDVLVLSPCGGGPGHALLAGVRRNSFYHTFNGLVQRSGSGWPSTYDPPRVFRYLNKANW